MLGFGVGQVLRFGGNLLLTRLLPREAFGIMLLVQVVLQGLDRFSDVGIGPAVVQSTRDDRRFLDTAWTIQCIRGVVLTLVAFAAAWPIADFFGQHVLVTLVPFAALSAVISGLQSSKFHSASRSLSLGRLIAINLLGQAVGLFVTVVWALASPSVWALAAGGVVSALTITVGTHLLLPGPNNRFAWDRESASTVLGFGKWVFISTLFSFLATQADRIIFGRMLSADTLGVYAIATLIATAPEQLLRRMSLRVEFPFYSQSVRDGVPLRSVFQHARRRVLTLGGWACATMVGGGQTLVALLYPEGYADAGLMLQILAVGTWFSTLEATLQAPLLARNEPRKVANGNLVKFFGMLIGMFIGFRLGGFTGALVGLVGSEVVRFGYLRILARDAQLGGIAQELGHTAIFVGSAALGLIAVMCSRHFGAPLLIEALLMAVVVTAPWAAVVLSGRSRAAARRRAG